MNDHFLPFGLDGALKAVEKEEDGPNYFMTMVIGEQLNNWD